MPAWASTQRRSRRIDPSSDGHYFGEEDMSNLDRAFCRFTPSLAGAALLSAGWACGVQAQTVAMNDDSSPLQEVVVTGQRQHYRGDVPLEEMPQAVQVI